MKSVFLFLLCFTTVRPTGACWLYEKQATVNKIQKNLALIDRFSVDRQFFKDQMLKMPKIFSWAVSQIGVESAFRDCDANQDGSISLIEMRETATCLDSCFKLGVVNLAI